jgi:hypothetical protein
LERNFTKEKVSAHGFLPRFLTGSGVWCPRDDPRSTLSSDEPVFRGGELLPNLN